MRHVHEGKNALFEGKYPVYEQNHTLILLLGHLFPFAELFGKDTKAFEGQTPPSSPSGWKHIDYDQNLVTVMHVFAYSPGTVQKTSNLLNPTSRFRSLCFFFWYTKMY